MGFLDKGSFIKHRNLGFVVRILEVEDGVYSLGWTKAPDPNRRFVDRLLLNGPWSASDLVREFAPYQEEPSRWDRLLDDSLLGDSSLEGS
jgi:hypothetical protein